MVAQARTGRQISFKCLGSVKKSIATSLGKGVGLLPFLGPTDTRKFRCFPQKQPSHPKETTLRGFLGLFCLRKGLRTPPPHMTWCDFPRGCEGLSKSSPLRNRARPMNQGGCSLQTLEPQFVPSQAAGPGTHMIACLGRCRCRSKKNKLFAG